MRTFLDESYLPRSLYLDDSRRLRGIQHNCALVPATECNEKSALQENACKEQPNHSDENPERQSSILIVGKEFGSKKCIILGREGKEMGSEMMEVVHKPVAACS
jgi:hypothetical protein